MLDFKDWVSKVQFADKPWLVLGKGPTFSKRNDFDLNSYNKFSLNHVVREEKVDVAHIVDIEVVEDCGQSLLTNCEWLIMPRIPNVKHFPGEYFSLADWCQLIPALAEKAQRGRLVAYDFSHLEKSDPWAVVVRYFSSEAALGILGRMGVKTVRSLGIDGGKNYSYSFDDLKKRTLLANGQPSFNLQFDRLREIAQKFQIDYAPLFRPMLIYVGTDESQEVATAVLEYSILKHASRPVMVTPMIDLNIPLPKDEKNLPRTGFSFHRWVIPSLCNYSDRALYVDADMLVFSDIAELWDIPFNKQKILCTYQTAPDAWKEYERFQPGRQFSVMLIDCPRVDWKIENIVKDLDAGKFSYENLMFDLCLVKPEEIEDRIPSAWNCLEHYEEGVTKLIHYTVVPTQPWKNDENPLAWIWHAAFKEAVQAGYVTEEMVERGIEAGHLKSSLLDMCKESLAAIDKVASKGVASHRDINAVSRRASNDDLSPARKVQAMEQEIRDLKVKLKRTEKELKATHKELGIVTDRLGFARAEISEYREHILGLERNMHMLYRSKTWKLGRVFTKPAEVLKKTWHNN